MSHPCQVGFCKGDKLMGDPRHQTTAVGQVLLTQLWTNRFIHHKLLLHIFNSLSQIPIYVLYIAMTAHGSLELNSVLTTLPSDQTKSRVETKRVPLVSEQMAATALLSRSVKLRPLQRCSKLVKEQRARLYIIWRCTVLLLCWHDWQIFKLAGASDQSFWMGMEWSDSFRVQQGSLEPWSTLFV